MAGGALEHLTIDAGEARLHVAAQGSGPAVMLLHGFPELWFSWRWQLPALAQAGWRALAPDLRGYGASSAPAEVSAYAMPSLAGDVLGLLDALELDQAVVVGHDWGAMVAWHLAQAHPGRVAAVAGLSVPFLPRAPAPPVELMRQAAGENFHYIVYFQEVGPADRELAADPRRTLCSTQLPGAGEALPAAGTGFLSLTPEEPPRPRHLSEEELAVFVDAFARAGFTGGLNWYRNLDRNWELSEHLAETRIDQPAMFLTGERDPVRTMMPDSLMDGWVTDLRARVVVPGAGHWVQQEAPEAVNASLLEWLGALRP